MASREQPGREDPAPALGELLERHRDALRRLVERRGKGLLSFESPDDLVQGIHLRALEVADRFAYRGEREFLGWIARLARQHFADRHEYWSALKRNPRGLLRLSSLASTLGARPRPGAPPSPTPGPATLASRREEVDLALRAIGLLLPRDQMLVRWIGEDLPIAEVASRLGISPDAAERARRRAVERLRKAYSLVSR